MFEISTWSTIIIDTTGFDTQSKNRIRPTSGHTARHPGTPRGADLDHAESPSSGKCMLNIRQTAQTAYRLLRGNFVINPIITTRKTWTAVAAEEEAQRSSLLVGRWPSFSRWALDTLDDSPPVLVKNTPCRVVVERPIQLYCVFGLEATEYATTSCPARFTLARPSCCGLAKNVHITAVINNA